MVGSHGLSSQLQPAGVPAHHPETSPQSSLRPPPATSNQSPSSQFFNFNILLVLASSPVVRLFGSYECLDILHFREAKK
ncbi:hypothetical protein ACFX2J_019579 [Malus domestica]